MRMKINLLMILLFCFCLFGCSKKEVHIEGTFGFDDNYTSLESKNSNTGVEITVESNEDKFSIKEEDIDLTTKSETKSIEEKSIEKAEQYLESDSVGNIVDSRDEINYYGLLQFIKSAGGIEKVASTYDREKFTEELNKFELVTAEEKQQVLEAIYNSESEERNLLIRDIEHSGDEWVYTDSGWKNVYEETNNVDYYEIDGGE